MSPGTCSSRLPVGLFASRKDRRSIGRWSMDRAACRRLRGATRTRWPGRSRFQIALRSTPRRFNAPSGVSRCDRSLAAFMVDGSRQNWWGHSRVSRAAQAGERLGRRCSEPLNFGVFNRRARTEYRQIAFNTAADLCPRSRQPLLHDRLVPRDVLHVKCQNLTADAPWWATSASESPGKPCSLPRLRRFRAGVTAAFFRLKPLVSLAKGRIARCRRHACMAQCDDFAASHSATTTTIRPFHSNGDEIEFRYLSVR